MIRIITTCSLLIFSTAMCSKKPREGVAVIVNGYEIVRPEILQTAEMLRESMIAAFPERAVEGINNELLAGAAHQLIANRLLVEEAKKRNITVTQEMVDSGYNALQQRFPDRAAFERELTKMGETDSSFKARIHEGLCLDSLMTQVLSKTDVIDSQECRSFYEKNKDQYRTSGRVHGGQIFLPFAEGMSDADKQKLVAIAKQLLGQIRQGTSFEEIARKHSEGPGAAEGGDIGWFKKGDLREDLEKPLFALDKGQSGDLVTTDIGVHILKKIDEEAEGVLPFEEAEKRIRLLLEIKARNTIVSGFIDSLTGRAKIRYIDTTLARKPELSSPGIVPPPEK